ncbi:MAG: ATP synthase F0 subunit C [Propionibacteriaceae bacterium]|jgi:F-type H+-transporting ATPase subunit c|nr:ATP synthase F0 subunit C [Actinomycetota bacterium]MCW5954715.1 ATP synthase F0 subunit C [Propionibacteriaceae bacterium]
MEITGSINMIGYALATLGPAIGVAWIFASVINGTARQPEARGAMMSTAILGFAVVEALAIIAIALAFVLQ